MIEVSRLFLHLSVIRCRFLIGDDRTFPTADFQLVPVGIFKKESVVSRTIVDTNLWPFEVCATGCPDQFGDLVHFLPGIGPERDPGSVCPVILVQSKTEKLGGRVATGGIKSTEIFAGNRIRRRFVFFANKSKLRQKFCIKLRRDGHVFHPQIDVIEQSFSHLFDFRFSFRIINFNPDQISSTAQTLMSTKPKGSATARITSSVTSVGTPDDFFGHETQRVASSAIFRRSADKCFSRARRSFTKRWMNRVFPIGRVAKLTPLGI